MQPIPQDSTFLVRNGRHLRLAKAFSANTEPARHERVVSNHSPSQNARILLTSRYSWDQTYNVELTNHASDPNDTGTVWFSDSAAVEKVLDYLDSLSLSSSTSFLDLGTGNGEMLFLLREEGGFEGEMLGWDYSATSVELAEQIANTKGLSETIKFETRDILSHSDDPRNFDVVLDKGTFDAISLSGQEGAEETYVRKVETLVRKGGLCLVTSCNWTEAELRSWFEGEELEFHGKIDYPVFRFGGQTGQSISTVCFKRRE